VRSPATSGPRYHVEVDDRHAHLWRVTLTLPAPAAEQPLSLPAWLPGSYLLREFARHLQSLQATQGGQPVPLTQTDKTRWIALCSGRAALVVTWQVAAFDTSVRGAWLDADRGFFNGSSLFLAAEGRTHQPHGLTLGRLPAGWAVATSMPLAPGAAEHAPFDARDFLAADYAELIDHPVELGRFWRGGFDVAGVPHGFVVTGAWPGFDGERLLADTARLCRAQVRLWHGRGRPPFARYLFMLRVSDDGAGGLEHRDSTALIASRRDLPRAGTGPQDTAYQGLLGLIGHEYFHAWNVKRLIPPELDAPDLGREAYTRLLWWFEGVTSYYEDLMLCRAGLVSPARFLELLAGHMNSVAATPGRRLQSVAQASFDAWTRYYRPDENTPNATVSYYAKGELVAACLDLAVRASGPGSLDGALRRLWKLGRPITEGDIADALAAEAGRRLDAELAAWVHGTGELPLPSLLRAAGVAARTEPASWAARLGLRLNEGAVTGVKVRHVLRGGAAERAGLQAGDELLAIDGWRLRRLDDALAWVPAGASFELTLVRDQRLRTLRVPALAGGTDPALSTATASPTASPTVPPVAPLQAAVALTALRPDPDADAAALARRRAWLGA
jgi:predicted metalloprotease with PDZ domain